MFSPLAPSPVLRYTGIMPTLNWLSREADLKALGLAKFADKHNQLFDRIELIRKKKGPDGKDHFYRLDMAKTTIRKEVLKISSVTELDNIFDAKAEYKV
jgi:hypothetical protein